MTKRKRRHSRSVDVRINWLQPHAEGFKEWLDERNYSPATIIEVVRLLALWADWVRAKGFELETLDAGLAASASVFRGNKKARAPQGAAKLFVTYLRNEGVLPPAHKPSLEETWPELAAFRHLDQREGHLAGRDQRPRSVTQARPALAAQVGLLRALVIPFPLAATLTTLALGACAVSALRTLLPAAEEGAG